MNSIESETFFTNVLRSVMVCALVWVYYQFTVLLGLGLWIVRSVFTFLINTYWICKKRVSDLNVSYSGIEWIAFGTSLDLLPWLVRKTNSSKWYDMKVFMWLIKSLYTYSHCWPHVSLILLIFRLLIPNKQNLFPVLRRSSCQTGSSNTFVKRIAILGIYFMKFNIEYWVKKT